MYRRPSRRTVWTLVQDLNLERWRRVDRVVDVRHEARIDAALHLDAWKGKGRLREGMVFLHKGEHDHVPDRCINAAGSVNQAGGAPNGDL
jgi:hypothetical protein